MSIGILLTVVLGIGAYLLPTIIASSREHRNNGAILALNILLGWTLIGWVAAIVWACTDNVKAGKSVET